MKKFIKHFTIIALLALICVSLLACKNGGGGGNQPDKPVDDPIAEVRQDAVDEINELFRMVNNVPMSDEDRAAFEQMKKEALDNINAATSELAINDEKGTVTSQFNTKMDVIVKAKQDVDYKFTAKIELISLFNNLKYDELANDDYNAFMQIKNSGLDAIDAATTNEAIDEAKEQATTSFNNKQAELANKKNLAEAKVKAISDLNNLYDGLNPNVFSETDLANVKTQLDSIVQEIISSTSVDDVNSKQLAGASALTTAVNTISSTNAVASKKQEAINQVNTEATKYIEVLGNDLTEGEGTTLTELKNTVISAINAATTVSAVDNALNSGFTSLNEAIATIRSSNVNVAKKLALSEINAMYDQIVRELLSEADLATFDEMKTSDLAKVNAASDAASVNSALQTAKEAFSTKGDEVVASIDVSKVKMFGSIFIYDGEAHSIYVMATSLPAGIVVEYEGNEKTEIGVYAVKAHLKNAVGKELKVLEKNLTIEKVKQNIKEVKFESKTYNWENGKNYTLTATNVPEGVKVVYENNTLDGIGKVKAQAKLYDKYDGELLKTLDATLEVKYNTIHNEEVFTSQECAYDGSSFTITLASGEASKYQSITYFNNTASIPGYYPVYALAKTADNEIVEYRAFLTIENAFSQEFRNYTDDMFVYFLSGDQSTLNIFMVDYEAFGFEHQDTTWYAYEKYTEEDRTNDLEELARIKAEFDVYNRESLNSYQKVDYDKIKGEIDYLDFMIKNPSYILMRQTYIDQFGGYAGDIPTTMEAYQVRTKQDIEDIISYIDSVDEAFASYVDYALDRAKAGYPLTNFTISNMIDYLDGVTKRKVKEDDENKDEPYYLIAILENKIKDSKEALNLTDDEVNDYVARLDKAFESFMQAHIDLADQLADKCMNLAKDNQSHYLASYGEKGKTLYEILLRNRLGITMPMEEYIEFIETTIAKYYTAYSSYSTSSRGNSIMDGEVMIIDSDDPNDIINYLKTVFAKTIVADLENDPVIGVAYMDKTVTANTTTLAYYMKSALDSTDKEFIHLNGDALGKDYLETFKTLAHEGYPGHLYAYVFSKENKNLSNFVRVSTNTGHGEGWAKYVECAVCDFLAETKGGDWVGAMGKSKYWDLFIYQIYTRIDVGIEYEGWDVAEVLAYLKGQNLNVDENSATDILLDLIEMPGQYAAYGYGQALFYELHDEAKTLLGENYDEIEFNSMLLGHGWIGLSDLEELYANYMKQKCFLCGVDFEK